MEFQVKPKGSLLLRLPDGFLLSCKRLAAVSLDCCSVDQSWKTAIYL